MTRWKCALALDSFRTIISGSEKALVDAIRRGADLRIGSEFIHNQHIDVRSSNAGLIREVAEFGVTYLVDNRWASGIMSLRQPVELPTGFGARPSMSFFLYNQDGKQGIARPYLDGEPADGKPGVAASQSPADMPKYHTSESWDVRTNAPSSNFIYDFDVFKYYVCQDWKEVVRHDPQGGVQSGSVDALASAFSEGCAVKVGISGLCSDLTGGSPCLDHQLFVEAGSCYYYIDQKLFVAGSHPVIRIKPAIPMRYQSRGWDFGWLVLRTDGMVAYRRCDPYTLKFEDLQMKCAVRWFVR